MIEVSTIGFLRRHMLQGVLVCLLLDACILAAQSQGVPIEHWVYRFLDRMQTRGFFVDYGQDMRPYSREVIASIINTINEKVVADPSLLSRVEMRQFERLKGEFHQRIQTDGYDIVIDESERERHLYTWDGEGVVAHFEAQAAERIRFENKQRVDGDLAKSMLSFGMAFRADLNKSLAVYAYSHTFVLSGTDSIANTGFDNSLGLPVTEDAFVGVDITNLSASYVVYKAPWFELEAGRHLVEWGPGYRSNLALSRSSVYYDLIKLSFPYKRFRFDHFHGFLNSDSTKYLVAHRFEIRPYKWLQLALTETVIYGRRDIEFLYLNPFAPIMVSERHLGNKDNNSISFDGSLFLTKYGLKLYGELFMDDGSIAKNWFNAWVNKWAIMAGAYWVNPFGIRDTDFRVEAVHIQPFVYSHTDPINTFSNYNNPLGHWLGPDSDDLYFEFAHQPHRDFRWSISWDQRRRGQNDINFGTKPPDDRIDFLGGVHETVRYYGFDVEWQIRRDFFARGSYDYIQSNNLRRDEDLDQSNHRLILNLSIDY